MATNQQQPARKPRRLVLCFDGTGNEFKADETDTNIVKLYELLDRESPTQYHYYQREFPHQPPSITAPTRSESLFDF